MKKNIFILLIGIVVTVILLTSGDRDASHKMHGGMEMDGNEHMMHEMMVTNDKEFLEGMIPHHEEAVVTANEVLLRGVTPEVRTLSENIVSSQTSEIEMMKGLYKEWYGVDYVANGKYTPMMRDLSTLSGVELDKQFVEDMIMHHMGAVMMAKQVLSFTEKDELKTLGENIVNAQTTEINLMNDWLQTILK